MFTSIVDAYAFLSKGGPVMPILIAGSILCFAVVLERFWMLRRDQIFPKRLKEELDGLLQANKVSEALSLCRASEAPLARVTEAGLVHLNEGKESLRDSLEASGKSEVVKMERRLEVLATLATIGPLLGLLGTVTGMIRTFMVVRAGGLGDPLRLSGGIAEALLCTAAGLVVAIPAYVFHRYFLGRVDRFALELEEFARKIVALGR